MYIASIDPEGFAAKSGKLQVQDHILACNGCDFTKDMTNSHVEARVKEMMKEPLLKMAISRGGFKGNLQTTRGSGTNVGVGLDASSGADVGMARDSSSQSGSNVGDVGLGGGVQEGGEHAAATPSRPTIKIAGEDRGREGGKEREV